MRWNRFLTVTVVVSLLIAGRAAAAERGLLLHNERIGTVAAPVQGTAVEVRVNGVIARARITQIFTNPTREWLAGIYIFPLPEGAAVDTLRMTVGDRVVEGIVQEKREARQTYEAAKQQGTKAALIEEQRAGVFTTSLANIGPGETIEVAIELQQIVSYQKGRFTLRFPMLLAPQYTPPAQTKAFSGACQPPVRTAGTPPVNPFAIHVDLAPGFPLGPIESPTHRIAVARGQGKDGRERYAVDLAGDLARGIAFADGDFVLAWKPAVGREPRAVYFSEEIDGEQYSLLMVMPPDDPEAVAARLPRETIFVIDNSGSMEGTSIEQARSALLLGLARLQPGDWFNVIVFHATASALFPASVPADAGHLEKARRYVSTLGIDGGTEMLPALQLALGAAPVQRNLVPQVVFVTDGQVTNDAELLAYIHKNLGEHRLFTVAIGPAPNASLLRRAAEIGRGTFTAVAAVDQVESGMGALLAQLESPMLRQIDIRWADPAAEAWPARVPDLYLGEPLVMTSRHTSRQNASSPVTVSGLRDGRDWSDELPAAAEIKGAGIDKLWARRKIDSLLDSLVERTGATRDTKTDDVRRQVTELGLRHHLITPYTSLVSVDVEPTAPAGVIPATRVLPVNPMRSDPDPGEYEPQETITVLGEAPLLDERRFSVSATVSNAEMQRIPTARDPWAVLQTVPGILTDRISVGGNESGDQSVWMIDGVILTDTASLGTSPGYYNFDSFEEMQIQTGGADAAQPTPGAQVNLLTKRGTNEWRASADAARSDATLQADHGPQSNRLDDLFSGGFESGGPVRKDSAWIWGAAHRAETRRIAFGGQAETTVQSGGALKVNLQVAGNNSAVLLAGRDDTAGSGLGAGADRAPETTWDRDGTDDHWKAEDTHIVSASFFLTATAGRSLSRLRDDLGGPQDPRQAGGEARIDEAGVIHGSWFGRGEDLRTDTARLDSAVFFSRGRASHELKITAEERRRDDIHRLTVPARIRVESLNVGEEWRPGDVRTTTGTTALWAQDTINSERFTTVLGLRFDEQDLGIAGGPAPRTLAPRLGLTWRFDGNRETLLRTSLSRFASRLGDRAAFHINPAAPATTYSLLAEGGAPVSWYAAGFGNTVDPHLRPEITDEAVLGLDRSLRSEFLVSLQATWRRTRHLLEERLLIRDASDPSSIRPASAGDWQPAGVLTGFLPDGTPYAVPTFDLLPGLTPSGGRLLTNGDRRQDALGLTLSWQKRLSDGWMSRGHLTWQDWTGHRGPAFLRYDDPTNTLGSGDDDGRVAPRSGLDGVPHQDPRFLAGGWSFAASGLVQLAGFDLSASVNGREGGPLPYYRSIVRERAGLADVQLTGRVDSFRARDLVTVDTRIARSFGLGDLRITGGLEVSNLFDERSVTARELDLGVSRGARPVELAAPRTLRLGLRLEWR